MELTNIFKEFFDDGVELSITQTMIDKSTIDANHQIRDFLKRADIVDFDKINKGDKIYHEALILDKAGLIEKKVCFLRPNAKPGKPGDPRFWVYNLGKYVKNHDNIFITKSEDKILIIPPHTDLKALLKEHFSNANTNSKPASNISNSDGGDLHYIMTSGVKNLLGKQLITDDHVAVFELVKNSFDAYASKVEISFLDLTTNNAKILIEDDGKGMNYDDLLNKWLPVGFSAKREGIEDQDYRAKLGIRKYYAGAKGVGRFSCDRLGGQLKLITRKDEPNAETEILYTDWKKFEENSEQRFESIGIKHEKGKSSLISSEHGTVLEISELNSNWDKAKILELKKQLGKLINPTQDNTKRNFKILINAPDFKKSDELTDDYFEKVNGQVKNFIFETLGFKSTRIEVIVSEPGDLITTELIDQDQVVYRIKEMNKEFPLLRNLSFVIFYLNQSAKRSFTTQMGFPIYKYGHVFVYKNGFRINPYGNFEEDSFGVDIRRAQKDRSRFSTRTISGRIDINGENENFEESTSRDGGLIRNEHFNELKRFYHKILGRLENYVVDVIKWGTKIDIEELKKKDNKEGVLLLIEELTKSDEIIDLYYNPAIFDILAAKQEKSVSNILVNLKKIVEKSGSAELLDDVILAQQQLEELKRLKEEAEEVALNSEISLEEAKKALEFESEKVKYFESSNRTISEDAKGLIHSIKDSSKRIYANIEMLIRKINDDRIIKNDLLSRLGTIKRYSDKSLKIANLITKADFKNQRDKRTIDIGRYLQEYIQMYTDIYEESKLQFEVRNNEKSPFLRKVSTLDLSVVIDNLISNSEKAHANKILIEIAMVRKKLEIIISDDGKGLNKKFLGDPDQIFELGVTETDGSGIGLSIARKILSEMQAEISFIGNSIKLRGACFKITFN